MTERHIHHYGHGYVQERVPKPRFTSTLVPVPNLPPLRKGEWYWVRFSNTDSSRPARFDHGRDGLLYFSYHPLPVPRINVSDHITRPTDFSETREWEHPTQ